ncbi:synaptopodin-2 isoform X2 [Xyrauchen texanus]|uniref:synaptopodin-2 isoform X2 n=1 Tax=Xyrauchen texanus TaxID=154827 RepID=UPI0022425F15|nr:synaptopodin-2 isoform X2 [Xyrauchen texanus]
MEHLPETKGKGVLMFVKRRQRMDDLSAEQEEMTQKGTAVHAFMESEVEMAKPAPHEESKPAPQEVFVRKQHPYRQQMLPQSANGMNGLDPFHGSGVPRPIVPNRTAKPFLGGHDQGSETFLPARGVSHPAPKKPESIFKVPVPVNTTPQVWSPTSDIIASRDERIAIPAIKTGILPEAKRRGGIKTDLKEMTPFQKKGDQRSIIEFGPEEDFLSLGAEACNFMQVPTIKQKNPPPVLPKPVINPAHPPWSAEGCEFRNSLPTASSAPVIVHTKVQAASPKTPSQPQPSGKAWASLSSQPLPQQALPVWAPTHPPDLHQSDWTPKPHPTQVSTGTADSLNAGPTQTKTSWTKSQNDGKSVASCPSQNRSSFFHGSKASPASAKAHASDAGASEGLNLKGKGAELFARRQTRMEKFVVDDEAVRANQARYPSPSLSMPSTWKFSPNVRAPPPVSYNPIVSPFYPLAAVKQPASSTSPEMKPKATKEKPKQPPKHLKVLDVMKHQPYQLDSSLFTYNANLEAKEASLMLCPSSTHSPTKSQAQPPSFEQSTMVSPSQNIFSKSSQPVKQNPSKATGQGFNRTRSSSLPQRLSSVSSFPPDVHPMHESLNRQYPWVEHPKRSLSSGEAAAQSPFSLDDGKLSTNHRKSLPETPAAWKHRVPYEFLGGSQEMAPVTDVISPTNTFSAKRANVYGPPFRPAQPLGSSNSLERPIPNALQVLVLV